MSNFTEIRVRDQDYAHKSGCVARKAVFMTIRMSMWIEICQTHGQDSRILLYWMKIFLKDTFVPGDDSQRFEQLPDLILCGLKFCTAWRKQIRKRKSMNGLSKNQSSMMLEDFEALTSSIRKMASTRKPFQGKSWKFRWRQLCALRDGNEKALQGVAAVICETVQDLVV